MISFQCKVLGSIVLLGFLLTPGLFAQSLSIGQALDEALHNNPGLRAQQQRLSALERDKIWSFQAFYPSVTAGAGVQQLNDTRNHRALVGLTPSFSGASLTGLTPQVFEPAADNAGLKLEAQFTLGISAFASMAKAGAAWASGAAEEAGQRSQLILGVQQTYYSIVALDRALDLAKRQEAAALARYTLVEAGRSQGARSEADALLAKATWTDRTIDRYQAEVKGAEARDTLALLIGRTSADALVLTDDIRPSLSEPSATSWDALDSRPDLQAVRAERDGLDAQVLGALALALPQVVVSWSADPGLNGWTSKAWAEPSQWSQTNGAVSVQLQWKLDSFLPGSAFWTLQADLADAQKGIELLKLQKSREAQAQVRRLLRSIGDSLRVLPLRERESADARRAAELAQAAFQAGIQRIVEVQDAEVQAQRAELGLIQERLHLVLAQAELKQALPIAQEDSHAR